MTTFERIAEEALKLPPEERANLAEKLEQSLPLAGFASPEIAQAWATEVAARIEGYERGETTAVSFDTAMERIRRRLEEFRDRPDPK